jgi:hypothetical protein
VIIAAVVFKFHRSLLQKWVCALVAAPLLCVAGEDAAHQKSPEATPSAGTFDAHAAERFAKLALQCVHKEYPNKISHVLNSDADVAPPRKLTPAFCGCYDWHSSVHGHWLLVRLVRTFPDAPFAAAARDALKKSLTAENLKEEATTFAETVGPASSGPTGCHGCCNCARNCGNGTIHKAAKCRRTCARSKKWRWND